MTSQTIVIEIHNPTITALGIEFDCEGILTLESSPVSPKTSIFTDPSEVPLPPFVETLIHRMNDYFDGKSVDFRDIPISENQPATPFQKTVWEAARQIRFGVVTTYGELAARIATPGHARAVGNALGANPTLIIVPCHRVLAAGGALGGFTAGLDMKRTLLSLEGLTSHI